LLVSEFFIQKANVQLYFILVKFNWWIKELIYIKNDSG